MGMYKELIKEFEALAEKQHRLYGDACDEGYEITGGKNNHIRVKLRNILKQWKKSGLSLVERKPKLNTLSEGITTWELFVPWEVDNGKVAGTTYVLTHQNMKNKEYLFLHCKRTVKDI